MQSEWVCLRKMKVRIEREQGADFICYLRVWA